MLNFCPLQRAPFVCIATVFLGPCACSLTESSSEEEEEAEEEAAAEEIARDSAAVFEHFDVDRDGFLSRSEMAQLEQQLSGKQGMEDDTWRVMCAKVGAQCAKGLTARELAALFTRPGGTRQLRKATKVVLDADPFA